MVLQYLLRQYVTGDLLLQVLSSECVRQISLKPLYFDAPQKQMDLLPRRDGIIKMIPGFPAKEEQ